MSIPQFTHSPIHPLHVIIVGGGITGLTAAYDLARLGHRVAVLEASARAGGLVQTDRVDGFTIEEGADSLLASKPAALTLVDELGLTPALQRVRPPGGAFVLRGHRLYRLPSPSLLGLPLSLTALATYDLLPPAARLRLSMEPLMPRRATSEARGARGAEDESVASFFRRRFGAATVDLIAQPLLGGIHAGDIEQLSMRALFPRLLALESHGSVLHGAKRERVASRQSPVSSFQSVASPFVALRDGMHTLIDALAARLGDAVQLSAPVERLERDARGWTVHLAGSAGASVSAPHVIVAAPASVAARLLGRVDPEAAALCAQTPYVSTVSVALAWPRGAVPHPLDGTGFVVARRHSDVRITACTWVSQKWEHRAPADSVLLRVFMGGAHDPHAVDLDDDDLVGMARRDLQSVLGITAAPSLARVYRWRAAGAQHLVGQVARMDALDARLAAHRGLHVAGSGFRAVGIPDCIADARTIASRVDAQLHNDQLHKDQRQNDQRHNDQAHNPSG